MPASPFDPQPSWWRGIVWAGNAAAAMLVLPLAAVVQLEKAVSHSEAWFQFSAQLLAGIPGFPGVLLRRAYYWWTLDACSMRLIVGYGAYFSHRGSRVAAHVYIGPYAVIGLSEIGEWALIGTRTSLLSGGNLHALDDDGRWLPSDFSRAARLHIGAHVWIGEGAILMADVGAGAMVAAGGVVSSSVAPRVVVAGNPARFVRHLVPAREEETG